MPSGPESPIKVLWYLAPQAWPWCRGWLPARTRRAVSAQSDHLGGPELLGGPVVAAPVCWVRLDAVARCMGGVGGSDGVGSIRAGPVYQERCLGWRARIAAGACSMMALSFQVRLPVTGRRKGWRMDGS